MITNPASIRPPHPVRIRPMGLVLAALLVVGGTYLATWLMGSGADSSTQQGKAFRDDSVAPGATLVDEATRPTDLAAIDTQIRIWGDKSAADARDDISAGNLAVLYLGRGRLTGDAADYERALTAAERAVVAYPTSTGTRALKATVLQATHDFTGALALAEQILGEEPENVDALAVAGDARLELGRLDQARATYSQIARVAPGPALDVRLARLAWLTGDRTSALAFASKARDIATSDGSSDPSFYHAQLGEFARITGHADQARASFETALAIRPTDQLALLGLARLDAFDGHDAAAIARLRTAAAIAPRPETLGLLTDLLARTGDVKGAEDAAATVRVIERLGGTAATLFDRQMLAFELDHGAATRTVLDQAIAAARIRPDAAGLDLVAWAAYRLGDISIATDYSTRARGSGIVDARVLYHAGAIAIARGDLAGGRALVRQAVDLGPALDPLDRHDGEVLLNGS